MPFQSTANAKEMPELTMLTILIQVAAIIKNQDGDGSIHGYVEGQGLTGTAVQDNLSLAVLDSIGDILLLHHQVLAIVPRGQPQDRHITLVLINEQKATS